MGQKDNIEHYL